MALSAKCWIICSPGTCFGQYLLFLMRAWAKSPRFFNSTIACNTQKPLSNTKTLPDPWTGHVSRSNVPHVLPFSSQSFRPKSVGRSFPSLKSTCQIMSLSAHPVSWYSLPNGQGLRGTYINPGHVYSLTHLDIDSSIALIQLGEKLWAIFAFQASINCLTSQYRSTYAGGSLLVYIMAERMFSNWFHVINDDKRNGAPSYMSTSFDNQNERRSDPSTVERSTQIPIHCISSPYESCSFNFLFVSTRITS